ISIHQNSGLTPPQGVPTDSIHHDIKVIGTPDGGYIAVPVTSTTERVKSGVASPAPPPGMVPSPPPGSSLAAPQAPPASAGTAKVTPPKAGVTGAGRVIPGAGKSLTPKELIDESSRGGAYMTTVERMVSVLTKAQDPKFN